MMSAILLKLWRMLICSDAPTKEASGLHSHDARRDIADAPSSAIGASCAPYIRAYTELRAAARAAQPPCLNLAYGRGQQQSRDCFAPPQTVSRPDAPGFHVNVHSSYGQKLPKNDSWFQPSAWPDAGFTQAALDNTRAPQASVGLNASECAAALTYPREHAIGLGLGLDRLAPV